MYRIVIDSGCQTEAIVIGRRGTYNTESIVFDLTALVAEYGDGTAALMVKRPIDESAYPAVTSQEDDTLTWFVSEIDTSYRGAGECEVFWFVDDGLAKTVVYPLTVLRDIGETTGTPPDPYQTWVDHLTDLGAETLQNAQDAAQSASDAAESATAAEEAAEEAQEASVHAPIIQENYWYIWSNGQYVNTGVQAKGEKGDKGDPFTYEDFTPEELDALVQGPILDAQTAGVAAVNAAGTSQVGAVNSAGTTQARNVNTAGAAQVAAVQAEGAAQTQAVEAKGQEVIGSIPSDYSDLSADVTNLKNALNVLAITDTVDPAPIVTVTDGADGMPVPQYTVEVEPVQDLHGYDAPWPAGGGKNLLKTGGLVLGAPSNTAYSNVTKRTFTEGTYIAGLTVNNYYNPSNTQSASVSENSVSFTGSAPAYGVTIPITGLTIGQTYTISATKVNGNVGLSFYAEDGTYISGGMSADSDSFYTATVPENAVYTVIVFNGQSAGNVTFTDIQLELGSSATSFAPYENVCPITGWTEARVRRPGQNIGSAPENGVYAGTTGQYATSNKYAYSVAAALPNKMYRVTFGKTGGTGYALYYRADGTFISSAPHTEAEYIITTPANCAKIIVEQGGDAAPVTKDTVRYITIEEVTEITITFPSEAGTVYGGTISVNEDGTGTLTVDRAMSTIRDLNFIYQASYQRFYTSVLQPDILYPGAGRTNALCESMPVIPSGPSTAYPFIAVQASGNVFLFTDVWTTRDDLNNAVGDSKFVYMLKAPTVIPLTASDISAILTTIKGTNNVWADTGNMGMTYRCDTAMYIDRKIAEAVSGT